MSVALVPYFVHDIVLAHVSNYLYAEIVIRPHFGHRGDSSPPKCGASSLSDQTDPIGDFDVAKPQWNSLSVDHDRAIFNCPRIWPRRRNPLATAEVAHAAIADLAQR